MKTFYTLILLFLSNICIGQSVEDKILEAIKDQSEGNFELSISRFDTLISSYPLIPFLYILRGEAIAQNLRQYTVNEAAYMKAVADFDKALQLDSTFFMGHRSRGLLNIFHQKFDRAIVDFSNAYKYAGTEEEQFHSISDRGSAYSYLKEFEKAKIDFEKALELRPNLATCYSNLALVYSREGKNKQAISILEKGLAIEPDNRTVLNNLGFIRIEQKEYEVALKIFNDILRETPNDAYALSNRGKIKTLRGDFEAALKDLNASITQYPENSDAFKNRGVLYTKLKEKELACADFEEANRLGFEQMYGEEINTLLKKHCKRK